MTVQELYDRLAELIEEGRSTLPVVALARATIGGAEVQNLSIVGEDYCVVLSAAEVEDIDPIEAAVNATKPRPTV